MPQGRQAKIINIKQEAAILRHLTTSRHPERDKAMFLLSLKSGLRAKEIAALTWGMITDPEGNLSSNIQLEDNASKGKGGRTIPLHPGLSAALSDLQTHRAEQAEPAHAVIYSERGRALNPDTVRLWFRRLYHTLNYEGCTSHSGRRTFITRAAKKVTEAGGSLRDVQQLAGHSSLSMTQRYIEGDTDAKRKLVGMI